MRRYFWLLLSLLLLWNTGFAQNSYGLAPVSLSPPEVHFSDISLIQQGREDSSLIQQIVSLIRATPAKSEISVAMFKFGLDEIADALIEAHQRGVWVQVIIDQGKTSVDVNELMEAKLEGAVDKFYAFNNKIAKKAIIHSKFILFSEVMTPAGPIKNVVVQTSSNFQESDLNKLQDMVILSDEHIYFGYHDFWHQIETLGRLDLFEQFEYNKVENEPGPYAVYFFPKRKNGESHGKDNVAKILEDIEDPASAEICFAIGKWETDRPEILEELFKLGNAGAKIEISVGKSDSDDMIDTLRTIPGVDVNVLKSSEARTHLKFFIIDAQFKGKRQQCVWTGSQNFSEKSLRANFEALLEIRDPQIYQQYLAYFRNLMEIH